MPYFRTESYCFSVQILLLINLSLWAHCTCFTASYEHDIIKIVSLILKQLLLVGISTLQLARLTKYELPIWKTIRFE